MNNLLLVAVVFLLGACGSSKDECKSGDAKSKGDTTSKTQDQSKCESDKASSPAAAEEGKLSDSVAYVFSLDNSLETFVKCARSGTDIDCQRPPDVLPKIGAFTVFRDPDGWRAAKMAAHEMGCFEGVLDGEPINVVTTQNPNDCAFEFQQFIGTEAAGAPADTWKRPVGSETATSFSTWFPFLRNYTFKTHVVGGTSCAQRVVTRTTASSSSPPEEFDIDVAPAATTWSSLFSLGFTEATREIKTAAAGQNLLIGFQPAVDSSALIAAGATDENVEQYFKGHFGDFLLLEIKDTRGTKAFCKQADSLTGSFTVPAAIMAKFDGNTAFALSRHKFTRTPLGSNTELIVSVKVGAYSHGNDVAGQVLGGGPLSIYVEPKN
jgi:hypothetical protein